MSHSHNHSRRSGAATLRLRGTVSLFLQAVPDDVPLQALGQELRQLHNVFSTHHSRVWPLDGAA